MPPSGCRTLIQIPTIASSATEPLWAEEAALFGRMRSQLEEFYPLTFGRTEVDQVGRAGIMLRLPGADADRPVVLMAHQDVVPVPADWARRGVGAPAL